MKIELKSSCRIVSGQLDASVSAHRQASEQSSWTDKVTYMALLPLWLGAGLGWSFGLLGKADPKVGGDFAWVAPTSSLLVDYHHWLGVISVASFVLLVVVSAIGQAQVPALWDESKLPVFQGFFARDRDLPGDWRLSCDGEPSAKQNRNLVRESPRVYSFEHEWGSVTGCSRRGRQWFCRLLRVGQETVTGSGKNAVRRFSFRDRLLFSIDEQADGEPSWTENPRFQPPAGFLRSSREGTLLEVAFESGTGTYKTATAVVDPGSSHLFTSEQVQAALSWFQSEIE